jgi:hypothetical protein
VLKGLEEPANWSMHSLAARDRIAKLPLGSDRLDDWTATRHQPGPFMTLHVSSLPTRFGCSHIEPVARPRGTQREGRHDRGTYHEWNAVRNTGVKEGPATIYLDRFRANQTPRVTQR